MTDPLRRHAATFLVELAGLLAALLDPDRHSPEKSKPWTPLPVVEDPCLPRGHVVVSIRPCSPKTSKKKS